MRYSRAFLRALFASAMFGYALTSAPLATAAIYSPQQALPASTIQQFLANPASLLSQGVAQMITTVRDLAASDPATVDAILGLLKSADAAHADAIGRALGQVALMALRANDPTFGVDLQTKVVQAVNTYAPGNPAATSAGAAFSEVVGGDIKLTAATGSTGIGGGGESQTTASSGLGGFFAGAGFGLTTSEHNTPDLFSITNFGTGSPGSPTSGTTP